MKNRLFHLIVLIYAIGCSSKDQSINQEIETISIPFGEVSETIKFSDFIDTAIVVLPLETELSKGVFLNTINQLDFFGKEIYALDYLFNQKIQVFDKAGKFLRKIGNQGQSPAEYLQPMGFLLSNDTIEILDVGKILKFGTDGSFISSDRYIGFTTSLFQKLGEGYAFISSGADEDNLILTDAQFNIVSSHFPYYTRALNPLLINPLYKNPSGKIIYRRNLIDTLFEVSDLKKPKPYKIIDYGDKKVNLNQLLESHDIEKSIQELSSEFAKTLYFFETKDYHYLAFTLDREIWIFIDSINSGKSVLFKSSRLTNDIMFDQYAYLIGVSGDVFYFMAKPDRIISSFSKDQIPTRFQTHKLKMEELVKNLDPEGNPVLFGVKMKF